MTFSNSEISVLIIGYKRVENILKIIEACVLGGARNFYVSLDGFPEKEDLIDSRKDLITEFANRFKVIQKFRVNVRDKNLGCAIQVLTSCDWFFKIEEFGIILEDDCIPDPTFIKYAIDCKHILLNNANILLFGGSQFDQNLVKAKCIFKSKYALTWGWGTSRSNWRILSDYIKEGIDEFKLIDQFRIENKFWRSGARRAYQGYTDVWDTILQYQLIRKNKYCLLPEMPLVMNIGFDTVATHTKSKPFWINKNVEKYLGYLTINESKKVSVFFLKKYVFNISFKNFFTTNFRWFFDKLSEKKFNQPLLNRWKNNPIVD